MSVEIQAEIAALQEFISDAVVTMGNDINGPLANDLVFMDFIAESLIKSSDQLKDLIRIRRIVNRLG